MAKSRAGQTRREDPTSRASLLRWGGLAAIVGAGVSLLTAVVPGLGTELAGTASLLYAASNIFMLLGLTGIYAHQHAASGVLGFAGFVVAVFGLGALGIPGEIA